MVAAVPRFGQRENEGAALSDSDYYLDMAAVFAGEREAFDPVYSTPGHPGAHHYGRPLLPYLAGRLGAVAPGGARAAFSALDVAAAWGAALALTLFLAGAAPGLPHTWVPGALFLTGFPQVNWGYHLLTDTAGLATALLALLAASALLRWHASAKPAPASPRLLATLVALFALQAGAFLTRETGWIVPVAVGALLAAGRVARKERPFAVAVLGVLLAAELPHALYMARFGLEGVPIPFAPGAWLDPAYALDFLVKSAVAFHVAWLAAGSAVRREGLRGVPPLLLAWSAAALLYMGAGYAHNSLGGIGYPLRMTYALFPAVYLLAWRGVVGRVRPGRLRLAAALAVALNLAVGVAGTLADGGASGVTVPGMLAPPAP